MSAYVPDAVVCRRRGNWYSYWRSALVASAWYTVLIVLQRKGVVPVCRPAALAGYGWGGRVGAKIDTPRYLVYTIVSG